MFSAICFFHSSDLIKTYCWTFLLSMFMSFLTRHDIIYLVSICKKLISIFRKLEMKFCNKKIQFFLISVKHERIRKFFEFYSCNYDADNFFKISWNSWSDQHKNWYSETEFIDLSLQLFNDLIKYIQLIYHKLQNCSSIRIQRVHFMFVLWLNKK